MRYHAVLCILFLVTNSIFTQNVMISNQRHSNEPAIMMNPDNPDLLIAAFQ